MDILYIFMVKQLIKWIYSNIYYVMVFEKFQSSIPCTINVVVDISP